MKKIKILLRFSTLFFTLFIHTQNLCLAQANINFPCPCSTQAKINLQNEPTTQEPMTQKSITQKFATRGPFSSFTPITISFTNNLSTPGKIHASIFKINALIEGFISGIRSLGYYIGELCIIPGTGPLNPGSITIINENTATIFGTPFTITSSLSGTGTNILLNLNSSLSIDLVQTLYNYDHLGHNITSLLNG